MGFLDEVKRQQASADSSTLERHSAPPPNVVAVQPCLESIRDTLRAFSRRLNAGLPDIKASYAINPGNELVELRQGHYKFFADGEHGLSSRFQFQCSAPGSLEFETHTREECDWLLDFLLSHGLKVTYRSHADWRFAFTVKQYVPVSLEFSPHASDAAVTLTVQNLFEIGSEHEHLKPEQIDQKFLAELQKAVQRQPSSFRELCGNRVSDDVRAQLQARISASKERRAQQLGTEQSENPPTGGLRGLLGKFSPKKP